jgi:hypothetical protein
VKKMLAKIPSQEKSEAKSYDLNYKLVVGIVVIFAILGLAGGYTIFPLLQSPKAVILTPNLNNNTTSYSSSSIKNSTKYSSGNQKSINVTNQSSTTNVSNKNTVKTNSLTQGSQKKTVSQNSNRSS